MPDEIIIYGKKVAVEYLSEAQALMGLDWPELQTKGQTITGIDEMVNKLALNLAKNSANRLLEILVLLDIAEDDGLIKKYLLDNEEVFKKLNVESNLFEYISGIILMVRSDELKEALLLKYNSTMMVESLVAIIFSFSSQKYIRKLFLHEIIKSDLEEDENTSQEQIVEVIKDKKTDEEKIKCIIPEVLSFLDPRQRKKIIIPIESDLLKKAIMSNEEITRIFSKDFEMQNEYNFDYHSFAYIVASYKEDSYKEEEIEKGLKENTLDGKDLAIIISSLKSDAKKMKYLYDKRVTPKLSFEDKAMIIESLHEEDADEIKFGFIKEIYSKTIDPSYKKNQDVIALAFKILGINLEQITNIICSMTDLKKKECLRDKEIAELLTFENICKIVTAFENDEEKYIFVRENIRVLNEAYYRQLREIVFSMRAKYKRKCLEDEVIASILKSNENDNYGRIKIIDIITSNYSYWFPECVYRGKEKYSNLSEEERQQELTEEDNLRVEFLLNNIEELGHKKISRIVEAINVKETKAALLIDSEIYGRLKPSEHYRIYQTLGEWANFIKLYNETTEKFGAYWTGLEEKRPKCNTKWKR